MKKQAKDVMYLGVCGLICFSIGVFLGWCVWSKELTSIKDIIGLFNKELIDICVSIANIVCGIVAIFALYFSVSSYRQTVNDERRNNTIIEFRKIAEQFFDKDIPKDKASTQAYLNELEVLATGINLNIYSIEIINILGRNILLPEYNDWAKKYIEESRKETKYESDFCEYETMIHKLQEIPNKKN